MRILKILLLIMLVGFYSFLGYKAIKTWPDSLTKGQSHRTDRLMPFFDYLTNVSQGKTQAQHLQIVRFIEYYQFLFKTNSSEDSIQEILAFCYFYDGRNDLAFKNYLESVLKDPDFFWNFYNLGLIYLSKNDITQAKECFKKALSLNPDNSFKHIFTARPYLQIVFYNNFDKNEITNNLKEGYQKAILYLQYLNASGDPKKIPIHPKLF